MLTVQPAACSSANWPKVTVFTTSSVPPTVDTTILNPTEPSSLMQAALPSSCTSMVGGGGRGAGGGPDGSVPPEYAKPGRVPSAPWSSMLTVQPAACSSANWPKVTVFTTSSVPPTVDTTILNPTEPSSLMQAALPSSCTSMVGGSTVGFTVTVKL